MDKGNVIMALIKCSECGKEISDQAESCPNCGCPIRSNETISDIEIKPKKLNKKMIIVAIAVILIIAAGVTSFFLIKSRNEATKAEKIHSEYIDNMNQIYQHMYAGVLASEKICVRIHDVWYNCIYEKRDAETDKYTCDDYGYFYSDFNKALDKLCSEKEFTDSLSKIYDNKNTVNDLYVKLQNPSEDLEKCYDAMESTYNEYNKIINYAVNPTGSLVNYTEGYNDADAAFVECSNKFKLIMPSKKAED